VLAPVNYIHRQLQEAIRSIKSDKSNLEDNLHVTRGKLANAQAENEEQRLANQQAVDDMSSKNSDLEARLAATNLEMNAAQIAFQEQEAAYNQTLEDLTNKCLVFEEQVGMLVITLSQLSTIAFVWSTITQARNVRFSNFNHQQVAGILLCNKACLSRTLFSGLNLKKIALVTRLQFMVHQFFKEKLILLKFCI